MPVQFFAPIDNYCERTGPEFWSEPLNAVTNLSFIIAGVVGLALCRRNGAEPFAQFLSWWVIVIGVGSALFHTFANGATMLADVLPIGGFILLYTYYVATRFVGFGRLQGAGTVALFYAAAFALTALIPDSIGEATSGTTGYLPALLALLVFGAWLARRGHRAANYLFWAAGVFFVSMIFRSLDAAICQAVPMGTHFVWHMLNGVLLGILAASAAHHRSLGVRTGYAIA